MNSSYQRLIRVALIYGVVCYLVYAGLSALAWRLFPEHHPDDELTQLIRWTVHIVAEKIGGLILMSLAAFLAARSHHPTRKVGINTAIATAIVVQLVSTIVYLLRFGVSAYRTYGGGFIYTISSAVALGWLFGFLAVWKQDRHERHVTAL